MKRDALKEQARLDALLRHEVELWDQGFQRIAGVDEVGLGPLAGPVIAGACILPRGLRLEGVDDSKKLSAPRREALDIQIRHHALAWAVAEATTEEIDRLNPYHAALLAMRRAVDALTVRPDHLLIDARLIPGLALPQRPLIKGDTLSMSIAAASIIAKVHRDRLMDSLSLEHPGYGFELHRGYGTAAHLAALRRLGASPIHRRSYAPVREALGLAPRQASLDLP